MLQWAEKYKQKIDTLLTKSDTNPIMANLPFVCSVSGVKGPKLSYITQTNTCVLDSWFGS